MSTRNTQTVKPVIIGLSTGGSAIVTQTVKVVISTIPPNAGNKDLLRGMI